MRIQKVIFDSRLDYIPKFLNLSFSVNNKESENDSDEDSELEEN